MKPAWIMTTPVLSTAHMPSANPFTTQQFIAEYEEGYFVFVDDSDFPEQREPADRFLDDVRFWMNANGFADQNWVRFDSDGEVVSDLRVYEWEPPCP